MVFSLNQHAISQFCFLGIVVFSALCDFLQVLFIEAPSTFTRNGTFCGHTGLLTGFSALCDIFREKSRILVLKSVLFPVGGKVVSESYRGIRAPFGCLETVFCTFHSNVLSYLKTLRFLSLSYSADFRRRLVPYCGFSKSDRGAAYTQFMRTKPQISSMFS